MFKKSILIIMTFAGSMLARCQVQDPEPAPLIRRFKLNLGVAMNTSHGIGFGPVVEPDYIVKDPKLSVGLRYMGIAGSTNSSLSFIATTEYYFYKYNGDYPFAAPFVGIGAGVYRMTDSISKVNNFYTSAIRSNQFGIMIRAGLANEAARLRLSLEYNFVTKTKEGNIRNDFFCIVGGYFIGGGSHKNHRSYD